MHPQTPHCGRRAGKLAKTLGCPHRGWPGRQWAARASVYERPLTAPAGVHPLAWRAVGGAVPAPAGSCQRTGLR